MFRTKKTTRTDEVEAILGMKIIISTMKKCCRWHTEMNGNIIVLFD